MYILVSGTVAKVFTLHLNINDDGGVLGKVALQEALE
jgi:hypothetical protein